MTSCTPPIELIGSTLYQWDFNRHVLLHEDVPFVSFATKSVIQPGVDGMALTVPTTNNNGIITAPIPNQLLVYGKDLICYITDGEKTTGQLVLVVKQRPRPSNYVFTQTEVETVESLKRWVKDTLDSFVIESYENLSDLPSIQGTTLIGELGLEDIGVEFPSVEEIESLFKE